jgi:hypothetical protein
MRLFRQHRQHRVECAQRSHDDLLSRQVGGSQWRSVRFGLYREVVLIDGHDRLTRTAGDFTDLTGECGRRIHVR